MGIILSYFKVKVGGENRENVNKQHDEPMASTSTNESSNTVRRYLHYLY